MVISLSEFTSGMTSSFNTTSWYWIRVPLLKVLVLVPPSVGMAMRSPLEMMPFWLLEVKILGRESTVKSVFDCSAFMKMLTSPIVP